MERDYLVEAGDGTDGAAASTARCAPIGVAIAADHPLIRAGLAALLDALPALRLLGQAAGGADAVALYQAVRPDLLLIALDSDAAAREAIARIRAAHPRARLLVLADGDEGAAWTRAGASACLDQRAGLGEIHNCVRALAGSAGAVAPGVRAIAADALSPRELEILRYLSAGNSNKHIARLAGIGVGTVKYHVNNILAKLNVSCRTQAACVAIRRGLVHPIESIGT